MSPNAGGQLLQLMASAGWSLECKASTPHVLPPLPSLPAQLVKAAKEDRGIKGNLTLTPGNLETWRIAVKEERLPRNPNAGRYIYLSTFLKVSGCAGCACVHLQVGQQGQQFAGHSACAARCGTAEGGSLHPQLCLCLLFRRARRRLHRRCWPPARWRPWASSTERRCSLRSGATWHS